MNKAQTIITTISGVLIVAALVIILVFARKSSEVGVKGVSIPYGQEGYVTVSMKGFKGKADAFDIYLGFDTESIEILGVDSGDIVDNLYSTDPDIANLNGEVVLMFVDLTGGDKPVSEDGDLAYIRFRPKKPKNTSIKVTMANVYDSGVNPIKTKLGSGKIEVH